MDSARPSNPPKFLTLQQAAQSLAVSIDVLISWNENNILKPTITPTGEIGYSEQQIEKFLEIRNSSQLTTVQNSLDNASNLSNNNLHPISNIQENTFNYNNQPTNNFSQINNYNFYSSPLEPIKKNKTIVSLFGIAAGFSVFVIVMFVILFSQENKLNAILYQDSSEIDNSNVLAGSVKPNFNESTNLRNPEKPSNLSNEGTNISQNKVSVLNQAFQDKKEYSDPISKTYRDQVELLESIIQGKNEGTKPETQPNNGIYTYSQKASFDTSSSCINCEENTDIENAVFDTEGNIKVSKSESEENKLIAASLAMGGINPSQNPVKQNSNNVTLISFILLGLITFYMLYSRKRQIFPAFENSANLDIQPQKITAVIENPKLLEVFQKTDGTVAMLFQGNEYRISKPELDSESDKFIERLMLLVGPNVKEIEYDSLQDENLLISTPLSKLVTRLGFVGIKRDLFFPRTSKTRVHFRKYLTADDLISMNISPDQINFNFFENN